MLIDKNKKESFIDLRERPYKSEGGILADSAPTVAAPPIPPKGPCVYIRDVKLPFSVEDINVVQTAKIKFKVRNVETGLNYENKPKYSYELELVGIDL